MTVPGPAAPRKVAIAYTERRPLPLRVWRGDWYQHVTNAWQQIESADVEADLAEWLSTQIYQKGYGDDAKMMPWPLNQRTLKDVMHMLSNVCHRESTDGPTVGVFLANVWLDPASDMAPTQYGLDVWNTSYAPYEYAEAATCEFTLRWLSSNLPPDDLRLLRQWIGYVLSGSKHLERWMVVVGPPRSGKGTILDMMTRLVGRDSVVSTNHLAGLASTFGLEPMLGKSLFLLPDVRWNVRDASDAVPALLSLTSRDSLTVNRKNKSSVTDRLPVRLTACSNDSPTLPDASGALAGRMMIVEMAHTHEGHIDPHLQDKVAVELPGILNWAIGGLRDLLDAGRFVEPAQSVDLRYEMRLDTSVPFAFAEECCIRRRTACVDIENLHAALAEWCRRRGEQAPRASIMMRSLQSAYRGQLGQDRPRDGQGRRRNIIYGLTLVDNPTYVESVPAHVSQRMTSVGRGGQDGASTGQDDRNAPTCNDPDGQDGQGVF